MPASKASSVLTSPPTFTDPGAALLAGLRKHALHLTGDAFRDLDDITMDASDPRNPLYLGTWRGALRLAATLTLSGSSAEIILVATKGATQVDPVNPQFGQTGPELGNGVLVAAIFHIAIFYLRAASLTALTNQPYTPRLKLKYELMGFEQGMRLPLDDAKALTTSFTYVDDVYRLNGLNLSRPPLPL